MAILAKGHDKSHDDKRRDTVIKTVILLILAFIIFVLATIAWFTMNKSTTSAGMSVKAGNTGFELHVADGDIGYRDLYELIGLTPNDNTDTDSSAAGQMISWRMADGDSELKPGSEGVLEFTVTPAGTTLKYSLDLLAYTATTHVETEDEVETEVIDALTEIPNDDSSAGEAAAVDYINKHIMYFTHRTGTAQTGYTYSGFISDKADFELELTNGAGTIYWIWPNTIGQIMLESTDTSYITGVPVLDTTDSEQYSEDRAALTAYMKTNASSFFSGSDPYSTLIDTLYTKRGNGQSYKTEFDLLSEGYNMADQTIGNHIDYVLIHLLAQLR